MDVWAMYAALPPHKQREFDRIYQQAQVVAEGMRPKIQRLEALCDELENAAAAKRAACDANANANPT